MQSSHQSVQFSIPLIIVDLEDKQNITPSQLFGLPARFRDKLSDPLDGHRGSPFLAPACNWAWSCKASGSFSRTAACNAASPRLRLPSFRYVMARWYCPCAVLRFDTDASRWPTAT